MRNRETRSRQALSRAALYAAAARGRHDVNTATSLRPISTARLVALHLQPINLVVFEGSYGRSQDTLS